MNERTRGALEGAVVGVLSGGIIWGGNIILIFGLIFGIEEIVLTFLFPVLIVVIVGGIVGGIVGWLIEDVGAFGGALVGGMSGFVFTMFGAASAGSLFFARLIMGCSTLVLTWVLVGGITGVIIEPLSNRLWDRYQSIDETDSTVY